MDEDYDETFDDYVETTVPIGQAFALCVAGITSLLLFVPVVWLCLCPSEEIGGNDDDDENGDLIPPPGNISLAEKLGETESAPLLSTTSMDTSGYGGTSCTSPGRRSRSSSIASSPRRGIQALASASASFEEFEDDEIGRLNALRFSDPTTSAIEKLKIIRTWDGQTKAMLGLGFPFLIQALTSAASGTIQMGVVGYQLGTDALSAYVIIDLFIKLTSDAVGNIIISGNTMISQIAESEDKNRAYKIGSYLQLSTLFYVFAMIPVMIFWSFCTEKVLLYLKFEPDMAEEGQRFARAYVLTILIDGIASGFQYTLDVVGFQVQSTIMTFLGEVFTTLSIVVVMCYHTMFPNMTLTSMGWAYVLIDLCYLVSMVTAIYFNEWLEEYYAGFLSNPLSIFQNRATSNNINSTPGNERSVSRAAVKLMLSNAVQYALSNFLFEGEWQFLLFFASLLGPAELAAWGVLGIIWEELEYIVSAMSEGCEVRVANTLGKGDVNTAKLITYKAIWISLVWGILVSVIFRLFEDEIPRLITSDTLLQEMVAYNLPMVALANLVSGVAIMAEHVLWCQNRAGLSTAIASGTSGLVTLPLAGLSSYYFHFNLIGQTAAVAIGASAFAALSMYAVVSSDWKEISESVLALHGDSDDEDGDGDDSDSEEEDNYE